MKLEEGKFYRTRDGEKVGPLYKDNKIWAHDVLTDGSRGWYSDGSYFGDGDHPSDLIAEWNEAPTIGTLEEIGAKVGDVVEFDWGDGHKTIEIATDEMISDWITDTWRIISRANSGPVITETITRKRIVPGVYGAVGVDMDDDDDAPYIRIEQYMTRADLIAARDVFNQLIDALEE